MKRKNRKMEVTNDKELITLFDNNIRYIYHKQKLVPLRGESHEYDNATYLLPNGKQLLMWYYGLLSGIANNKHSNRILDDILFLSDEIVYFTAHLYLYRPLINNPLDDVENIDGREFFFDEVNFERRRYGMYVDVLFEKTYSYWNRTGNIIALFFPDKFPEKENIYFVNTINKLESEYSDNDNFKWLLNFKKNEYKKLNDCRREITHNLSNFIKEIHKQSWNFSDRGETEKLVKERLEYADYFKKMNELCIEGFEKTLSFLEYVKSENI